MDHALIVGDIKVNELSSASTTKSKDLEFLAQAEELLYRDPQAALTLLEAAVEPQDPRPEPLWLMAQAQFALREHDQALATLEQAAQLESSLAQALKHRINALSDAGLVRQALAAVDAVPTDLRDDPFLHVAMESFYTKWQYFAHAFVLGPSRAPWHFTTLSDRVFWYVGGPLVRHWPRLRRWAMNLEEERLLDPARGEPPHLARLGAVSGVSGSALTALRASLDAAQVRLRFRVESWRLSSRMAWRARPGVILMVWPALWFATTRLPRSDRPGAVALPALAGAAVAVCIALLFSRLTRNAPFWWRLTRRDGLLRVGVLLASGIGVGEAYLHRLAPPGDWQWAGYGLIAAPAASALISVVLSTVEWRMSRTWRGTLRRQAHFEIIDDLLWLLYRLDKPGLQTAAARLSHARALDGVAAIVEEFLVPVKLRTGLSADGWLAGRAKGWAEALRHFERALVAETHGQSDKTLRFLRQEIRCLATGRLGSLAWRAPQIADKKPVRDRLLHEIRNLLVALLPLAAVVTGHLLVHFTAGVFTGALLTTGAWAVLALMSRLDPELDKKLTSVQQLTSAVRQTPRMGGGDPPRETTPV